MLRSGVMRYRTLIVSRQSFGNRPYRQYRAKEGALRSDMRMQPMQCIKKKPGICPAFLDHAFIVPVSNHRWCHDNASGNRCGVCLP